MGISWKDRKGGVHKGRDGGWTQESMVSLKPGEGSISGGRKQATVSKVAGKLDVIMGSWPVVRTGF